MRKYKIELEVFLNWYFSDKSDIMIFGNGCFSKLKSHGIFTITAADIFNSSEYIPTFLINNYEGDETEVSPKECILVFPDHFKD